MEKVEFLKEVLDDFGINIDAEILNKRLNDLFVIPEIKVRYHSPITPIEKTEKGNFIDLRAAHDMNIKKGDFKLIPLGVSIKLPDGYWGQVVPRSSLFKKHGLIMTNSFGVIDSSYCGDDDEWMMPVYATKDTKIEFDERICQFRIVRDIDFTWETVDHLDSISRGGFGSTGAK